MSTLLQLHTSLFGESGQSTQLTRAYAQVHQQDYPEAQLLIRDLGANPVPHLSAQAFAAAGKTVAERTPDEQQLAALGDALIAEVEAADVLVIGLPMYNFGVPSSLKAWFDHIARAGRTFRYTTKGPEGLLKGKRAIVFATRGGIYAGTALDSQTRYVRDFLGFLGIKDVEFVYAEGLGLGAERRDAALAQAREWIAAQTTSASALAA